MISDAAKSIIETELHADEDLLWAHVISDEAVQDIPPVVQATMEVVFRLIWVAVTANGIWQLLKSTPEQVELLIKIYIPLIGVILLAQWFFKKTTMGQRVEKQTRRSIYQNAIITDKRILLFNHGSDERRSFTFETIHASQMDYENGGLALSITPHGKEKKSLLVGMADFKIALNIIKSNFLKTGHLP